MDRSPEDSGFQRGFWKFLDILTEICLLSGLWIVFSLPIVTIGASTTALYSCTMRFILLGDKKPWKSFVPEFKSCFGKSTVVWLALVLLIAALGIDAWFYVGRESFAFTAASAVVFALLTLAVMFLLLIFPYMARFDNTIKNACVKAFRFGMGSFISTLSVLFVTASVIAAAVLLFRFALLVVPGIAAYLDSLILLNTYKKNIPGGRGTPRF